MDKARKIPLKVLEASEGCATIGPNGKPLADKIDYREMLTLQLGKAGAQGITVAEIGKRLDLLKALKTATDFWIIDAESHAQLAKALENEPWNAVSPNLFQFVDDVVNAPFVDAELKAVT